MTKKQAAHEAVRLLKEAYPDAICSLEYRKPHELMIATRLAAQCTDARVNIVCVDLFDKYRSVRDFAEANLTDVEEIIKSCGLYRPQNRQSCCRRRVSQTGDRLRHPLYPYYKSARTDRRKGPCQGRKSIASAASAGGVKRFLPSPCFARTRCLCRAPSTVRRLRPQGLL